MPDKATYEYEFDPNEENNTAASVFALAVGGGDRVLDLGSGPGIVAGYLARNEGKEVTCVDADPESLKAAVERGVGDTIEADLDQPGTIEMLKGQQFDVIILADVLEHLREPEALLESITELKILAPTGFLVVSIPNANHEGVVAELLSGRFQYRSTGLLDATHIRFFTHDSFSEMANRAGYAISRIRRTSRTLEQTEFSVRKAELDSRLRAELQGANPEALTYQFVFRLDPSDAGHELAALKAKLELAAEEVHELKEIVNARDDELEELTVRAPEQTDSAAVAANLTQRQLDDEIALKVGFQNALIDVRGAARAHQRDHADKLRAFEVQLAEAHRDTAEARREVGSLEHQIEVIHASETWRMGRFLKRLLAPVVLVVNRIRGVRYADGSGSPATVSTATDVDAPTSSQRLSFTISEASQMRERYAAAVAPRPPRSGSRSVYFAVYTTDLDAGRGDIYVAVGLGNALAEQGWDVHYLPSEAWVTSHRVPTWSWRCFRRLSRCPCRRVFVASPGFETRPRVGLQRHHSPSTTGSWHPAGRRQ